MANTANSALTTNFNVSPYYDDYDELKNFYRILYRPGRAVQARELTQMQTILQKQVDRVGKHFFEEGAIVIPGLPRLQIANSASSQGPANYVKVRDTDTSNANVSISLFDGITVRGTTTGVNAVVQIVADGSQLTSNTKTIYVDYITGSNTNNTVIRFAPGEILTSNIGNLVVLGAETDPIGYGSTYTITSGVVFSKGHFISFPTQEVILDRYNPSPSCKVGFKVYETIVTNSDDSSLLDPALEASNYSAPGADRFKLDAELQVRALNDTEDLPNFVTLFSIEDGILKTFTDRTNYSVIKDEFAKRTFDESGDYYVKGLDIELREQKDNGTNGGRFVNGDANLISVKVEPGVAYVKGYEVGTIAPTYLTIEKSNTFSNVTNQIASAFLGSYVTVEEAVGKLTLDQVTAISLYDTAQNRISTENYSGAQTGNIIGTANVASLEYNSGTLGTAAGRMDLYLMDIKMLGSNSFADVRSVYVNNPSTADFCADIVLNPLTANAVISEPFNSSLLYYTGSNYTRTIKNTSGSDSTLYYYMTTSDVTMTTSGTFSVSAPNSDNVAYTGTLSTTDKRELFFNLNESVNVSTGLTATSNGGNEVRATGGGLARFNVGDKVEFSGSAALHTITSIANTTHMTIDTVPGGTLNGNTIFKAYKVGDYIDLTSRGFNDLSGGSRNVTVSGSSLAFDLEETFLKAGSISGTLSFRVKKENAVPTPKTLRTSRIVLINTGTHPSGTAGPFSLGVADVFKIRQIRTNGSAFSLITDGTSVTSNFTFDNGQKDTHYDHASVTPKPGTTPSQYILVEFDYFEPDFSQHRGYFTLESYIPGIEVAEIPIFKSPTSGKSFDLRNHLDFRPVKVATATDSTTIAGATTNPSITYEYNNSDSLRLVAPSTEISFDYSYYLARKDVVHVNKDKTFSIKKGLPSATPVTPEFSDNEMALAVITVTPFPSISPYYAKLINRQDIACSVKKVAPIRHTMREIGVMKERIGNLEYYAALSLLEKSALDLTIPDENGMDRFKNGIFVDTFTDHLLGATYNEDYRIVVDPKEKSIRPLYSMHSIKYDYLSGTNIKLTGDLVTLNYQNVVFANVTSATTTLNTEKSTYRFIGNMTLVPGEDVWIDTQTAPPNCITINDANLDGMQDAQQVGGVTTTWNSWQTSVTGYKVYSGTDTNRVLVGTYTTQAEAERAAQNARTLSLGATIETVYESNRTGTESFNYADADSTSLGSRVIDTQIVPYIRAQTLMGSVTGLKPYAKFTIFFDSIDMSDYVRPVTESEFNNVSTVKTWTYTESAPLLANANGELWFRLRLPDADNLRFTVGQKNILITDSPTNSDIATSFAEKMFFAQGVIQTKQDTILSTRQVETRQRTVTQSTNSSTFSSLPALPPPPPPPPPPQEPERPLPPVIWQFRFIRDCLAYVMPIKAPDGEEGVFITAIEVFCSQKHPTLGVWFELRELDAGGGITLNQVPFSEKWYKNAQVPISEDGKTNPLRISFDSPVFLYSDKSYALVIHPEANNPNYYFWASKLGETDINTGQQVTSRAGYGTTFTTNNDVIWVPLDQVDLTCIWYRARFDTSGSFTIGNKAREKLYLKNITEQFEGFGEPIVTGDKLTLTGYSGATIVANDFIVGGTSGINARVSVVTGGKYSMANIRYSSGETVTVRDGTTATSKGTATISLIENGRGFLDYYRDAPNSQHLILTSSNGNFAVNDTIFDISDAGMAQIKSIENMRYTLVDFEPAIITFSKTTSNFLMNVYANVGTTMTTIPVDGGENYEFSTEMAIRSRSKESSELGGARSNRVTVTMATSSDYLSPVFDIAKTQSIIVDNVINSNTYNEDAVSGGNLFNKYISKIVTLAEDQDAEDIRVILTAYRPPNTDVQVWIKILNGEDSDTMQQRPWTPMEKSHGGDVTYSSVANKKDFKELTFLLPESMMTGTNVPGEVAYTNSQGIKLSRFKSFQIKIGLISNNSAIIPRVADLRAIALQK